MRKIAQYFGIYNVYNPLVAMLLTPRGGVNYWYNWLLSKLVITCKAALDAQNVSMCHLQPKAGDPANVDFTQRKTDWISVRSTRMSGTIPLSEWERGQPLGKGGLNNA